MSETRSSAAETEEQLILRAQESLSQCRWVVGECAAKWTKRFARGRTDADFGNLIGLSGDQVYQRRRVWESFADVAEQFPHLRWSHFYCALNWDDAMECLQWAEDMQGTVAQMRAWRRAQHGEDLTTDGEDLDAPLTLHTAYVQDPGEGGGPRRNSSGGEAPFDVESEYDAEGNPVSRMAGVARDVEQGENYAPFRSGATTPPREQKEKSSLATPLTTEQLAKRLCSTLERCAKAVTTDFIEDVSSLPEKVRERLRKAVEELNEKLGDV